MKNSVLNDANMYSKKRKIKKRWYTVFVCLAAAVAFCTTYALMLPAVTLEREICEIPEHTHTPECYRQVTSVTAVRPVCSQERLELHRHTYECFDYKGELICGYADFVVHQHESICYDENGDLWCPLPEIYTHTHTKYCYAEPEEEVTEPIHFHTDECWEAESGELICDLITEPEELSEPAEPLLICENEEIILHKHTKGCFDLRGSLICGKIEVLEHIHSDDCFEEIEEPIDTETLTCTLSENENHIHTPLCYGTWELTCGMEEHTHSEECQPEFKSERREMDLIDIVEDLFDSLQNNDIYVDLDEFLESVHIIDESSKVEPAESSKVEPEESSDFEPEESSGTDDLISESEEQTEPSETLPIYGYEEIIPHQHTELCFDQFGNLICSTTELSDPADSGDSSDAAEETVDNRTLTCTLPEDENHTHTSLCYGISEPVFDPEENTHPEESQTNIQSGEPEENKVLFDDGAYVSLLSETGSEILTDRTDSDAEISVISGDMVLYDCCIDLISYSDESFSEGRVKLEFVLPLTEKQAAFDLSYMTWLDRSEGYEPVIASEIRIINGTETECQVLTGYVTSAVPGETKITAAIRTADLSSDAEIYLQISAAMEFNEWNGVCELHQTDEKLTITTSKYAAENEQQSCYEQFKAEIEAFGQSAGDTEDLQLRLDEAYSQGKLTEENYNELCGMIESLNLPADMYVAETAIGDNWKVLRDSGWFEEYSSYSYENSHTAQSLYTSYSQSAAQYDVDGLTNDTAPSDVQVEDRGGENQSDDASVTVSKTISGTELENVFDITLKVQTSMNISEVSEEPDMAVVIVMDISNTMNSNFGGVTRYAAAMNAAEYFLDQFAANNSLGISKIGYVAFNTDAHQIFGLQSCSNQDQANSLKNTMRTETGRIINASGYKDSHSRFTNVEAGLAMASDMLNGVSNKYKYIIFLSDGFPTTYIKSGYSGYDPYDSTGRFYDHVLKRNCLYGTSYSDEAAIRARNKAVAIKNSGTTIFSIGVDVAGQTIQQYITQSEGYSNFSVVDRTGTTYEIGDANSTEAYKNWLQNSIGSGYYYDSTDSAGLSSAYKQIFEEIKYNIVNGSAADWVAEDPLPTVSNGIDTVEFIGFYDQGPELVFTNLTGEHEVGGENTAVFNSENDANTISWDLKKSGYIASANGSTTTYTYTLVYRVRLMNENSDFVENRIYPTNDTTTLQYRTIESIDGNLNVSDPKSVEFPIPSVIGYLADLSFSKTDLFANPLADAEFTLSHDTTKCNICRGDDLSCVTIDDMTEISGADGTVTFTNIPSGHTYSLKETRVPDGYRTDGNTYSVKVAYDEITVTVSNINGDDLKWNGTIVNLNYFELPDTGGSGIYIYTVGGLILIIGSAALMLYKQTKRRKNDTSSSGRL